MASSPELAKHAPDAHPERPERLEWAMAGAALGLGGGGDGLGLSQTVPYIVPQMPLTTEEMLLVHTRGYLEYLEQLSLRGGGMIAIDTEATADSALVGRLAAAAADTACRLATDGVGPGLAVIRPPGHHAMADAGSGFCLYNNVALAARLHQARGGGRVAILDWDVHHGNGTQDVFYADPEVLYISMHESPLYPFTGWLGETGHGPGRGTTINLPLPGGLDDDGALMALQRVVLPCIAEYAPDLVLISAGQDGHYSDPMSSWRLTGHGYAQMAAELLKAARGIGAATCAVLEGGYTQVGLRLSVAGIAAALGELPLPEQVQADRNQAPSGPPRYVAELERCLDEIVAGHRRFWAGLR